MPRVVILLFLMWLLPPHALAKSFELAVLEADVPFRVASGPLADRFEPTGGAVIHAKRKGQVVWYRLRAVEPVPADDEPQIVLGTPSLTRVQAWLPGREQGRWVAMYGDDSDPRYAPRALVIDLPGGLEAGEDVFLRIDPIVTVPMEVSIESRDDVHRADLSSVAFRAAVMAVLLTLAVISFGFWIGVGDRAYGYFALLQICCTAYLAASGGELRGWVDAMPWLATSTIPPNLAAAGGLIFSNLFMRRFLELRTVSRACDRALLGCTVLVGLAAALLFIDTRVAAALGNLGTVGSVALVGIAAIRMAWAGSRAGRILLLSWSPLFVAVVMQVGAVSGVWQGPAWSTHALASGYALTSLLLTVGLADRMLAIRRERDDIDRRASTDALTGVLSRPALDRCLHDEIAVAQRTGRPLSVIFFDIDHFKRINDTHGHGVGDECLRIVAMRARNRLRGQDQIGRFGGDEMVVVLPDTGLDEARAVAEALRVTVNCRPLVVGSIQLPATLSLGAAEYVPGESAASVLERADSGLYASKAAGRNCATAVPAATVPPAVELSAP